ncbi:MAG: hypothetical protein RJA36_2155 [Pseudomonadota bacterium]|jgi:2-polyprenyl-3-methyl-5-hydroxy-6-metoxy-1,4-benzoquinol methylase
MIEVVSATRMTLEEFWSQSALGRSLGRLQHDHRLVPRIFFENRRGLSEVFNECLAEEGGGEIVVFIHDDVWIDDCFLADRVLDAANVYDVFGVVGNRRCVPLQPSWAFLNIEGLWDERENLSGTIAHGPEACGQLGYFGPAPADCELLDGVFLGVRKQALKAAGVGFDPAFHFHFYDVDFCMTARRGGLRLGTWPIALTHQSTGGYGQGWLDTYQIFHDKWSRVQDTEPRHEAGNQERNVATMKQTPAHSLINRELMEMIPAGARRIVDVGCMHGQMAQVYKQSHPEVQYVGIDIDPDYAAVAARHCDEAFAADVEQLTSAQFEQLFPSDCWVFGDCLEHLRDPWTLLRRIRAAIDPDGCVLVCMPNAQHWGVQWSLLSGQFRYQDSGLLDRTHLRWFTRTTMLEMFQETGWSVAQGLTRTLPAAPQQAQVLAGIRTFALASGIDPELAVHDAQPFQYMFKLIPA